METRSGPLEPIIEFPILDDKEAGFGGAHAAADRNGDGHGHGHGHGPVSHSIKRAHSASTASSTTSRSTRPPPSRSSETRRHRTENSSFSTPPPSRRGRKGLTVHWPFQSIATDTLSVFTAPAPELFRRATWQPPKLADDGSIASPRDSTLIPDYVVNFIRGETPESVARRKRNGGNQGKRAVDITHQHRPQKSHAGLFGIYNADANGHAVETYPRAMTVASGGSAASGPSDTRQMLPGSGAAAAAAAGRRRGWRRLTVGWRSGVALNVLLALVVLLAGFVCLVLAGFKIAFLVGNMTLFRGSCAAATDLNWGLHAVVSVVMIVLLVGANYAFQVLSSPTRSEVAAAHDEKRWLEIGVPSLRNLGLIGKGRAAVATILVALAVVTQVIYNSLIFTTQTGMSYNLVAVKESFLTGSSFSNASSTNNASLTREDLLGLQSLAVRDELANLTVAGCIDVFTGAFNVEYQAILLVLPDSATSSDSSNSLVATAKAGVNSGPGSEIETLTTSDFQTEIIVKGSQVQYCRAQAGDPSRQTCSVELNGILLAVLVGLNLIAALLTASTLFLHRSEPLVTLGDAIASFLRDPDPATCGNALLSKENIRTGFGAWGFAQGKYWSPRRASDCFWYRAPSLAAWLAAGFWWIAIMALAAGVLILTVVTSSQASATILSRFGAASAHTTYLLPSSSSSSTSAAALAIVASTPQLLLAGLYLSVNALLTAFFLSHESSLYAILLAGTVRRPLRVSADPVGHQTTSLYLTLPRPLSWALAVWFAAMSFVLGQACFAVSLSSADSGETVRGVGFSGVALAVLLAMLVVLALLVAGLSLRRAPPAITSDGRTVGNPLVLEGGSCSAVVSARCHRIPGETDVWATMICWGVIPEMGESPRSHVTYSARPLMELDTNHLYV